MSIKRTVSLTGINSSEIYSLSYPQSVLKFAEYDFSGFIRRCTDYCKDVRKAESTDLRILLRSAIHSVRVTNMLRRISTAFMKSSTGSVYRISLQRKGAWHIFLME